MEKQRQDDKRGVTYGSGVALESSTIPELIKEDGTKKKELLGIHYHFLCFQKGDRTKRENKCQYHGVRNEEENQCCFTFLYSKSTVRIANVENISVLDSKDIATADSRISIHADGVILQCDNLITNYSGLYYGQTK